MGVMGLYVGVATTAQAERMGQKKRVQDPARRSAGSSRQVQYCRLSGGQEQRVKGWEEGQKPKSQGRACFQKERVANSAKCCRKTWSGLNLSNVHRVW